MGRGSGQGGPSLGRVREGAEGPRVGTLAGREKLVYAALWWGLFHLRWRDDTPGRQSLYVSQSMMLPEWTGLGPGQLSADLKGLEKARLITRRPDLKRGRVPQIKIVPISVRYVRLQGLPVHLGRKQVPLYRLLPEAEREQRFQFWQQTLNQEADLPAVLWDAYWDAGEHDWVFTTLAEWLEQQRERRLEQEREERRAFESRLDRARRELAEREAARTSSQQFVAQLEDEERHIEERQRLQAAQHEQRQALLAAEQARREAEDALLEEEDEDEVSQSALLREQARRREVADLRARLARLSRSQLAG